MKAVQIQHNNDIIKIKQYILESEQPKLNDIKREFGSNLIISGVPESSNKKDDHTGEKL